MNIGQVPCKFFIMVLAAEIRNIGHEKSRLIEMLERTLGSIIDVWPSEILLRPPEKYTSELGSPISSFVAVFDHLISPTELIALKHKSLEIERILSIGGKRLFNLNPGYLDSTKVVVASGKKYYSRVYVGSGVFIEIELYYDGRRFRSFHYTFPEYKSGKRRRRFHELRGCYLKGLRLERYLGLGKLCGATYLDSGKLSTANSL